MPGKLAEVYAEIRADSSKLGGDLAAVKQTTERASQEVENSFLHKGRAMDWMVRAYIKAAMPVRVVTGVMEGVTEAHEIWRKGGGGRDIYMGVMGHLPFGLGEYFKSVEKMTMELSGETRTVERIKRNISAAIAKTEVMAKANVSLKEATIKYAEETFALQTEKFGESPEKWIKIKEHARKKELEDLEGLAKFTQGPAPDEAVYVEKIWGREIWKNDEEVKAALKYPERLAAWKERGRVENQPAYKVWAAKNDAENAEYARQVNAFRDKAFDTLLKSETEMMPTGERRKIKEHEVMQFIQRQAWGEAGMDLDMLSRVEINQQSALDRTLFETRKDTATKMAMDILGRQRAWGPKASQLLGVEANFAAQRDMWGQNPTMMRWVNLLHNTERERILHPVGPAQTMSGEDFAKSMQRAALGPGDQIPDILKRGLGRGGDIAGLLEKLIGVTEKSSVITN